MYERALFLVLCPLQILADGELERLVANRLHHDLEGKLLRLEGVTLGIGHAAALDEELRLDRRREDDTAIQRQELERDILRLLTDRHGLGRPLVTGEARHEGHLLSLGETAQLERRRALLLLVAHADRGAFRFARDANLDHDLLSDFGVPGCRGISRRRVAYCTTILIGSARLDVGGNIRGFRSSVVSGSCGFVVPASWRWISPLGTLRWCESA